MRKNKLLLLLALLLTAATGAWATDYTTLAVGDVIKVGDTFTPTADGAFNDNGVASGKTYTLMRADIDNDYNVTEKTDGAFYVFKYVSIMSSPYIHFGKAFAVTAISDGLEVTKIEDMKGKLCYTLAVHESAAPAATTYSVKMKGGTVDAKNWSIASGEKSAKGDAADGLTGLSEGDQVTIQYTGRLKVKGVKATSDAAPAKTPATVTTAPTGAAVVGVGKSTALVSGGAAEGGTLMYAMTTVNTKPTSMDGFSGTEPTAQGITASGKVYVWYYVKGDDTHSDSEIAATAIEVPVADIVWDVTNVSDLSIYDTDEYEVDDVTLSGNADQVSAKWKDSENPTKVGIEFSVHASGGFTFTAPAGKKFTKIDMKPQGAAGWDLANLGEGWDMPNTATITWTGSAASTVGLLTGANSFSGKPIISIAFYLSE